jgi:hypothetical protein
MKTDELSKRLTVRDGGLYTCEVASAFGVSRPKAWKIMRALELAGVVEGFAEKRSTGDPVDRKDDGRPATVGAEIRWFAPMDGENEGVSDRSFRAAVEIRNALGAE